MSYTLTIDEPEVVSYATRQGARFRDELRSLVLEFVSTQMKSETSGVSDGREALFNGKAVLDALRACPGDMDGLMIPERTCAGRVRPVDFASLLRDEA